MNRRPKLGQVGSQNRNSWAIRVPRLKPKPGSACCRPTIKTFGFPWVARQSSDFWTRSGESGMRKAIAPARDDHRPPRSRPHRPGHGTCALAPHLDRAGRIDPPTPPRTPAAACQTPAALPRVDPLAGRFGPRALRFGPRAKPANFLLYGRNTWD